MNIRAAGYVRVSDESQVDGHPLGAQRSEIERWCDREAHDLVEIYEDPGLSADTDDISKRPAFSRLLADAEAGKRDLVVVHTIDRWARNVAVQALSLMRLGGRESRIRFRDGDRHRFYDTRWSIDPVDAGRRA